MKRARILLGLFAMVLYLASVSGCKKEGSSSGSTAKPAGDMASGSTAKAAGDMASGSTAKAAGDMASESKTRPRRPSAMGAAPRAAEPGGPAALVVQDKEEQGTVLRVLTQKGSRTIITQRGARREKLPTTYEVHVGLSDGTRLSFMHLNKPIKQGSKVTVQYKLQGAKKLDLVLKEAVPREGGRILVNVLPTMKEITVAEGGFQIRFPAAPQQQKTDLGTLHRYEYVFDQNYRPDTYYFISTRVEGDGGRKLFKQQAEKLLALTGGTRIKVNLGGPRKERKLGVQLATGRFSVEIQYFQQVGHIWLWLDSANKILYGAWMHAYSRNRLAEEKDMQRQFFESFSKKQGE